MTPRKHVLALALIALAMLVDGMPATGSSHVAPRQSLPKLVFAHFMIGIMSDRNSPSDYDGDMQRAKAYGIDAFALNIGVDPYTDAQLGYAYQSAANNGMKVFISFDFNWYNTGQGYNVGQKIGQYASLPAQLFVNGKAFASSFAGDGLDVNALRSAAGRDVLFLPNFHPGQGDFGAIDGALNWMAWPNNGRNKAPNGYGNVSVQAGDQAYAGSLSGKPYLAPVSPWFSTHYGPEVSYSKNWVFPSDLLWYDRWNQILALRPQFVEIVTWNDYGESHYVGPLSSKHQDDGGSKWVNDMPHNGWLDMAKPYIAAYKAGATSVNSYIQDEQIVYWYRPTLRGINCDSTDTTMVSANNGSGNYFMGRPDGWQTMSDSVFVVTLLKNPGTLTVTSGGNTQSFSAPAGAAAFSVPMGVGRQSFAVSRNGQNILAGVSLRDVSNVCPCGLYNFNAFVGRVPPTFVDQLGPDALNSLTQGLHVATCYPSASLPTSAPPYTGSGGQPTSTMTTTTRTTSSPTTTPPPTTSTTTTTKTTTTSTSTSTTKPPTSTPTTTPTTTTKSGSCTITASSQIFPTNCMQAGCVWRGPAGSDDPDYCDGGHRRHL